ncbi:unnamed protein product [Heligmosomoides polygyrus]|uniref:Uncharacterized protein n=1 Tax=Heligmosomoides polygyrus TaxID=6339 RepID=A0A183GNM0_HELPZ|nr:unnamed protein product [Heligmosomoides polygyrus]
MPLIPNNVDDVESLTSLRMVVELNNVTSWLCCVSRGDEVTSAYVDVLNAAGPGERADAKQQQHEQRSGAEDGCEDDFAQLPQAGSEIERLSGMSAVKELKG